MGERCRNCQSPVLLGIWPRGSGGVTLLTGTPVALWCQTCGALEPTTAGTVAPLDPVPREVILMKSTEGPS